LGGEPDPKPAAEPAPPAAPGLPAADGDKVDWTWPARGRVTATFTDAGKGIDIAGAKGEAVLAAGSGRVVYSGTGLRGYGKLVILKHNETWLSAYAHNEKLLVNEGDVVKKGQKIAEMGASDTDSVKLHFEIRKQGSPVDPLKLLPPQP
jgi:lipoprotein NlpD